MHTLTFKKKVLVISNYAPPAVGGSPHVFYNLFSQFDPASYVIYTHEKNLKTGNPARKLPCTYYTYAPAARRGSFSRLTAPFRQGVAFLRTVRQGLSIIKKERVETLIGTSDKGTALLLTLILSKLSGVPYALYMLDPYRGNDFPLMRQFFASIFEPIFFQNARVVIVTNKGHRDLYRRQYGDRFAYAILYHAAPASMEVVDTIPESHGPPHTILYSGSIYEAQDRSIRNLIGALETMPENIRLELYVPKRMEHAYAAYASHALVSIHTAAPEEVAHVQQCADILFLPLSWVLSAGVLSMAIPGKTPEYLAAGRPILVHAPPYAVICAYAREEKFAHVVDTEDQEALIEGVRKLLTDATYAQTLTEHARAAFEKNHRAKNCAQAFKKIVEQV